MSGAAGERAPEAILRCAGLTLGYSGSIALRDVSFVVRRGEFVGVIGPNGAGKTTLLKGILGLLPPLEGSIAYQEEEQARGFGRRAIGYVPQIRGNDLWFPATALEVVLMGLYGEIGWFRRPRQVHRQRALESLREAGLDQLAWRPLNSLSAGQQQRVMIARALVSRPEMLILDEPTSAVDLMAQEAILRTLEDLNKRRRITIIIVSHDLNEIVHLCDRMLLLEGQGCISGTPNEVLTGENLRALYGNRVKVYEHKGHPHVLVGDFPD